MDPHQIYTIIHFEFEFKCSLNWKNLKPTNDPKVSYCEECKKNVNLCTSNDKIDESWEKGLCLAHPLYKETLAQLLGYFYLGLYLCKIYKVVLN